jgi:hypothetical protein
MKPFISGVIAALIIAIGSAYVLQMVNKTADVAFSTEGARVTHENMN